MINRPPFFGVEQDGFGNSKPVAIMKYKVGTNLHDDLINQLIYNTNNTSGGCF